MTVRDIINFRLINQQITQKKFKKPEELTSWLCGIQAQDFSQAKWAVGLRLNNATETVIEDAFTKGKILRTHVLRPTWHFVTPADIRWMLNLTAPRLTALSAGMFNKLELDKNTLNKCCKILQKHLQDGKHLSRTEIIEIFKQAKISTEGLRFIYIMFHGELNKIVTSGAKKKKQHTYALFDERVPDRVTLDRDEALAELSKRYFTSRGPATIQDFTWWSGLSAAEAKLGIEIIKSGLIQNIFDGKTYWMNKNSFQDNGSTKNKSQMLFLLPAYDEYVIAYKNRTAILDSQHTIQTGNGIFNSVIILEGQIIGIWKRTFEKDKLAFRINLFINLNKQQKIALENEIKCYSDFLNMKLFAKQIYTSE